MQAIYNRQGYVVAWLSGKDIYDRSGIFIGYILGNLVYNHSSKHIGALKQSFFRDIGGHVVGFLKGAKNGPALPSLKSLPSRPVKKSRPSSIVVPPPPVTKPMKNSWSKLEWEAFIGA